MRSLKKINNVIGINSDNLTIDNVYTEGINYSVQILADKEASQYREAINNLEGKDREKYYLKGTIPKRVDSLAGSIEYLRTRFREKGFESEIAGPWKRSSKDLERLVSTSFLYGLSTRDIERLLKPMGINISRSKVSRINKQMKEVVNEFEQRDLSKVDIAILSLDATYVLILDGDPENKHYIRKPVIRALGLNSETGYWELLSLKVYESESKQAYQEVLQDLKRRGLNSSPAMFLSDFADSIAGAVKEEYPLSFQQGCLFHYFQFIYRCLPKKGAKQAKALIQKIGYGTDREEWEKDLEEFEKLWAEEFPKAAKKLKSHLEEIKTCFILNDEFKTNNVNERANEEDKRLIKAKGGFKSVESAERIMILNTLDYLSNVERKKQADPGKIKQMKEIYEELTAFAKKEFGESFMDFGFSPACPAFNAPVIWIDLVDLDYDFKELGIKTKVKALVCFKLERRKLKQTLLWSCPVFKATPAKFREILNLIKESAIDQPEFIILPANNLLLIEAVESVFDESRIQVDLRNFNEVIRGLLPNRWQDEFTKLFKQAFENDSVKGMPESYLNRLEEELAYHHFYSALKFFRRLKNYMTTFFDIDVNYFFYIKSLCLMRTNIQLSVEDGETNSEYFKRSFEKISEYSWCIPVVYKEEFRYLFERFNLREKQKECVL